MIKNFSLIQKIVNSILKNKYSNEFIYGLPIFYIQKGHNESLKPFYEYFKVNKYDKSYKYFFKIREYIYYLFFNNKNLAKNINHKTYDIFLISNIIFKKKIEPDYIYGNLSNKFNDKKINTLTIYKNFTSENFKKKNFKLKNPSIILSKTSSFFRELSFLYGIFLSYKSLIFLKKNMVNKNNVSFITYMLKLRYLIPIVGNLRLSYQIISLVNKYQPKIIILPFENHAWERFLVNRLKLSKTKIITSGYQFTTFSKNQFSKYTILKNNFNPDLILSSGSSSFRYLTKVFKNKIKVINFGSHRLHKKIIRKKNFNNLNFLMVPESPLSEVNDFFQIGIQLSKKYSNCNFILRLHPMSKSKKLINDINHKIKKYKNLKLSKNTIEEDFSTSSYMLYRSSSLCINAPINGLLPIYLDFNSINLDPFFEINKRLIIKSSDDLRSIILLNNIKKQKLLNIFTNYSLNYFEKKKIKNTYLFNFF